jgi:hypothetical protein
MVLSSCSAALVVVTIGITAVCGITVSMVMVVMVVGMLVIRIRMLVIRTRMLILMMRMHVVRVIVVSVKVGTPTALTLMPPGRLLVAVVVVHTFHGRIVARRDGTRRTGIVVRSTKLIGRWGHDMIVTASAIALRDSINGSLAAFGSVGIHRVSIRIVVTAVVTVVVDVVRRHAWWIGRHTVGHAIWWRRATGVRMRMMSRMGWVRGRLAA